MKSTTVNSIFPMREIEDVTLNYIFTHSIVSSRVVESYFTLRCIKRIRSKLYISYKKNEV